MQSEMLISKSERQSERVRERGRGMPNEKERGQQKFKLLLSVSRQLGSHKVSVPLEQEITKKIILALTTPTLRCSLQWSF